MSTTTCITVNDDNGSGLRVCLWLSGCDHRCPGCQNPQTWNSDSGLIYDKTAKNELFAELRKDYISGLSLSGGDPLHENNLQDLLSLLKEIRLSFGTKKTIWLYSGYTWEQIFPKVTTCDFVIEKVLRQEIVSKCDVMVDGRYIHELRNIALPYRGSTNQRLIDINKTLKKNIITEWKVN